MPIVVLLLVQEVVGEFVRVAGKPAGFEQARAGQCRWRAPHVRCDVGFVLHPVGVHRFLVGSGEGDVRGGGTLGEVLVRHAGQGPGGERRAIGAHPRELAARFDRAGNVGIELGIVDRGIEEPVHRTARVAVVGGKLEGDLAGHGLGRRDVLGAIAEDLQGQRVAERGRVVRGTLRDRRADGRLGRREPLGLHVLVRFRAEQLRIGRGGTVRTGIERQHGRENLLGPRRFLVRQIDGSEPGLGREAVDSVRELRRILRHGRFELGGLRVGQELLLDQPHVNVGSHRRVRHRHRLLPTFHRVHPLREPAVILGHPKVERLHVLGIGRRAFRQQLQRDLIGLGPLAEAFLGIDRIPTRSGGRTTGGKFVQHLFAERTGLSERLWIVDREVEHLSVAAGSPTFGNGPEPLPMGFLNRRG